MKFQITSNETYVWIHVRNDTGDWLQLSTDLKSEFAAKAVCELVEEAMFNVVKTIRASAYAAGWADAKAKRTMKKHFAGCINGDPNHVGY